MSDTTIRQDLEHDGKAHVPFADWIECARDYATGFYGSDVELGDDADMRQFYDDAYDYDAAVDEVFRDGAHG